MTKPWAIIRLLLQRQSKLSRRSSRSKRINGMNQLAATVANQAAMAVGTHALRTAAELDAHRRELAHGDPTLDAALRRIQLNYLHGVRNLFDGGAGR